MIIKDDSIDCDLYIYFVILSSFPFGKYCGLGLRDHNTSSLTLNVMTSTGACWTLSYPFLQSWREDIVLKSIRSRALIFGWLLSTLRLCRLFLPLCSPIWPSLDQNISVATFPHMACSGASRAPLWSFSTLVKSCSLYWSLLVWSREQMAALAMMERHGPRKPSGLASTSSWFALSWPLSAYSCWSTLVSNPHSIELWMTLFTWIVPTKWPSGKLSSTLFWSSFQSSLATFYAAVLTPLDWHENGSKCAVDSKENCKWKAMMVADILCTQCRRMTVLSHWIRAQPPNHPTTRIDPRNQTMLILGILIITMTKAHTQQHLRHQPINMDIHSTRANTTSFNTFFFILTKAFNSLNVYIYLTDAALTSS